MQIHNSANTSSNINRMPFKRPPRGPDTSKRSGLILPQARQSNSSQQGINNGIIETKPESRPDTQENSEDEDSLHLGENE